MSAPLLMNENELAEAKYALVEVGEDLLGALQRPNALAHPWKRWIERMRLALKRWHIETQTVYEIQTWSSETSTVADVYLRARWPECRYLPQGREVVALDEPIPEQLQIMSWLGATLERDVSISTMLLDRSWVSHWKAGELQLPPVPIEPVPAWTIEMSNLDFARRMRQKRNG